MNFMHMQHTRQLFKAFRLQIFNITDILFYKKTKYNFIF